MHIATRESRPRRQPPPRLPWRRILVPIDFSRTSLRALDVAVPLSLDLGARLFLLSVIEPSAYPGGAEAVIIVIPDAVLLKQAKAGLLKLAKQCIPPSVPVTTRVEQGRACDVICRVAMKQNIDLIILTTHGRTGLERMVMGSTAERVVRHARCPVYLVRPGPGRAGPNKKHRRQSRGRIDEPMKSTTRKRKAMETVAGAALGAAVAGPVGALAGGLAVQQVETAPTPAAQRKPRPHRAQCSSSGGAQPAEIRPPPPVNEPSSETVRGHHPDAF